MLALDHVFCLVPPDGDWADRLEAAGWLLDPGSRHAGQFALRGRLPDDARADYRLHEDLGFPLWVHRDDETVPERPLVVVLDLPGGSPRRPPTAPVNPGSVVALRHTGPAPANAPPWTGPPCRSSAGPHLLEVVVDRGSAVEVTDLLSLLPG